MSNLLCVLGAEKTGTSTLVGMLNCHPKIFIMHEWFVDKKATRHGSYSYTFDPNIKKVMRRHSKHSVGILFKGMANQFEKAKYNYTYFGDKWAELGDLNKIKARISDFESCSEVKTIFAIRDIRTWICHENIKKMYNNEDNIVPVAIDYLYYYINSFKLKNNIQVRIEDVISDYDAVLKKIHLFLQPDINDFIIHANKWWTKIGIPNFGYNTFPKTTHKWWLHHGSARIKPKQAHIDVKLKSHIFWDAILPIFDKYYNGKVVLGEVDMDLQNILDMKDLYKASMAECYENIVYNNYRV